MESNPKVFAAFSLISRWGGDGGWISFIFHLSVIFFFINNSRDQPGAERGFEHNRPFDYSMIL